jgi:hypothetical protein
MSRDTSRLARRSHPHEGLTQHEPVFFGKAVEQLDAAHQQVTVGGMCDDHAP